MVQTILIKSAWNQYSVYLKFNFYSVFLFILIAVVVLCICIGIGIVFALMFLFALFALVSLGIISTSILVGVQQRSYSKGFKSFILLSATLLGAGVGGMGMIFINRFLHLNLIPLHGWLSGIAIGLVAGLILSKLILITINRLVSYFKSRIILHKLN